MPIIDTFLKLMLEKNAERLVLVADEIPFLLRAGETIELSMPALGAATVRRISQEIASAAAAPEPADGRQEGTFRAADGADFGYLVTPHGASCRIEIHAAAHPPAPVPSAADDPLAAAVAGFVQPRVEPPPATAPPRPCRFRRGLTPTCWR
jgi:hypothetical protein